MTNFVLVPHFTQCYSYPQPFLYQVELPVDIQTLYACPMLSTLHNKKTGGMQLSKRLFKVTVRGRCRKICPFLLSPSSTLM